LKRYIIVTIGKTQSGKTTFAKELESKLEHVVIIDQDNYASFLQNNYTKLQFYKGKGLTSIIVYFDLPECLLRERIKKGNRSTNILRNAASFEQVLDNQAEDMKSGLCSIPSEDESEHFFTIQGKGDKQLVLDRLAALITI
jgi:predicted kinase